MTGRKLAIVALIAAALVVLAVVTEVVLPRISASRSDERTLLLGPSETIDAFTLEHGGERLDVRSNGKGGWSVTQPGRPEPVVADVRAIDDVVTALRGARITSDVGPAKGADLASYELSPPRATLSWTRPAGRSWTLALGKPALGEQAHAMTGGRIVLVPQRLLAAADHGLDWFRAKRVLEAKEDEIAIIDVQRRPDQVQGSTPRLLLRRDRVAGTTDEDEAWEWTLAEPSGLPANPARVASLVSRLSSLMALGFGEEHPDAEALETKGLAQPSAVVKIALTDGRMPTLAIGDPSPAGNAWARLDDGPIVEIRADVARDALLPDDFWRDNRVVRLPKWRLVNVKVTKGWHATAIDFEMSRDPGKPWRMVKPVASDLPQQETDQMLDALEGILCGRFEDDLAKAQDRLDQRWDFEEGAGGVHVKALALMPDGTPRRADCDMVPFAHDRNVYFAARTVDEMGRMQACVTTDKDVDAFLKLLLALLEHVQPAPTGP